MDTVLPQREQKPRRNRNVETIVEKIVAPAKETVVTRVVQAQAQPAKKKRSRRPRRQKQAVSSNNGFTSAPHSKLVESVQYHKDLAAVLAMIGLCGPDTEAVRYSGDGSGEKTAAVVGTNTIDMSTDNCAQGFRAFLFRRLGINLIISCAPQSASNWKYDAVMYPWSGAPGALPSVGPDTTVQNEDLSEWKNINIVSFTKNVAGTNWDKHSMSVPCLISKKYPDKTYIYLDVGEIVHYKGNCTPGANLQLRAQLFKNGKNTDVLATAASPGSGASFDMNFQIATAGWYTFQAFSDGAVVLNNTQFYFQGTTGTVPACHRLYCSNQYCDQMANLPSVRVLASSIKCTNTTPDQYLGGKCVQSNFSSGQNWENYDSFNSIAGQAKRYDDDAKEGSYGYLKFASLDDLQMVTASANDGNGTVTSIYETIETDSQWIGVAFSLPATGNQQFSIVQTSVAEFLTTNAYNGAAFPSVSPQVWQDAKEALKDMPQFTRNKMHLRDIGGAILNIAGKAAGTVLKYGPPVLKTLGSVIGGASSVASFLDSAAGLAAFMV